MVAQYAPGGERQAFYVQSLARIDEVLSVVNSAGKFWYQADALGSVYTLTTAAGDVRARGGYDVFGEPVAEYGQQVGQPFGFTGREHELESGLVYARARYLSPGTGQWNRADPIGLEDGPNIYGYVGAQPTAFTDPTGKWALTIPAWLVGPVLTGLGAVAGYIGDGLGQAISIAGRAKMCGIPLTLEYLVNQLDGLELEIAALLGAVQAAALLYLPLITPFHTGLLGMTFNIVQFLVVAAAKGQVNVGDFWGFWAPLAASAALGFYAGFKGGPMPTPALQFGGQLLWRQIIDPGDANALNMLAIKAVAIRAGTFFRSVWLGLIGNLSPVQICPSA